VGESVCVSEDARLNFQFCTSGVQLEARIDENDSRCQSVIFDAEITIRRKRLSAELSASGLLLLDHELNASFSELSCSGKGAIGTLASALIKRNLGKLQNQRFPLLGFNFGGLRLREMNVEVGTDHSTLERSLAAPLARNKHFCRTEAVGRCDRASGRTHKDLFGEANIRCLLPSLAANCLAGIAFHPVNLFGFTFRERREC
jgi:hypothetical protein